MRKFDTKVQHLKYKVLREVAREAWAGRLAQTAIDIPKTIVPGKIPTMRCCVYKERAILAERVRIAMGLDNDKPNVIEVIDIACDECPMGGYEVTNACRGCLAKTPAVSVRSRSTRITWRTSIKRNAKSAAPARKCALTARFTITNAPAKRLVK